MEACGVTYESMGNGMRFHLHNTHAGIAIMFLKHTIRGLHTFSMYRAKTEIEEERVFLQVWACVANQTIDLSHFGDSMQNNSDFWSGVSNAATMTASVLYK
ncbi:hypothetical protein NHP190003_10430 [Helicobacter sp. NHP19-003]|uniref:Uncharacterized protein n=1 Tax=Helicobacter gastrocanis TaxID=2849641 RepID=A0ABN6I2F2_9HELI|nr:hypothetical protein NHP190003_10430 [Helicobacter sp. NHP19-003]